MHLNMIMTATLLLSTVIDEVQSCVRAKEKSKVFETSNI